MTTGLGRKGQVVIPKLLRDKLELEYGDDFEVYELDGEIVLRPISKKRNEGLCDILLNPPCPLDIPDRENDDSPIVVDFSE